MLTQENFDLYIRFKAGKLARPKKRKGTSLFERGRALEKYPLAVFVFDIITLDTALDEVLDMCSKAQSRAEDSTHWASCEEDVVKWEERSNELTTMQMSGDWDVIVEAAKNTDVDALLEDCIPELECE